jgi:hypothetical protein
MSSFFKASSKWMCVAFLVVLTSLGGCGGSGGGSADADSANRVVQISSLPFANLDGLNGHGRMVVASYLDSTNAIRNEGYKQSLAIYQQDTAQPDQLVVLGNVDLGVDTLYKSLSSLDVNEQWATATINFNLGASAWVALVAMVGPTYSLAATIPFDATLDHAVAHGHWLVVSAGTSASLLDITNPQSPVLSKTFTLSASTTSIVSVGGGFLLITNNGYGYLDPVSATLTETADSDIKASTKASLVGAHLYISGPSKYAGKTKVAKLDVSVPSSPSVMLLNDQIDGVYPEFAYDGAGGFFLVAGNRVQRFVESTGSIVLSQSALLSGPISPTTASQFYASQGRFYNKNGGILISKMP